MAKLAFGCGHLDYHRKGYKNVDIRKLPHVDYIADIGNDLPWKDNTVDEILAESILEHFPHGLKTGFLYATSHMNTVKILMEWHRVLKYGGRCIIKVPNIKGIVNHYVSGKISRRDFWFYLYGGQEYHGNIHYSGFDPYTLRGVMRCAGFNNIVMRNAHNIEQDLDEENAWEMAGIGTK